jgi:hypothetical protein
VELERGSDGQEGRKQVGDVSERQELPQHWTEPRDDRVELQAVGRMLPLQRGLVNKIPATFLAAESSLLIPILYGWFRKESSF